MKQKSSAAQRAASSRYRERNKLELQRKARERMAKRRAKLKKSEEAWCAYTAKAREHAARYRASHAAELALGQVAYRARHSIARVGFNAWHDAYLKRHPRGPPPEDEELGDWPESSDSEHSARPISALPPPFPTSALGPPTPPPESAPYDDHLNYFLDYLDPTMALDYVPKPGQRPFFQRGKQRLTELGEVAVGGGKKAPGEHLDVIEGELGLIRGEDGAVHVVAGGTGGGHAVRVVAARFGLASAHARSRASPSMWPYAHACSDSDGSCVNASARPRAMASLSVNRGGVLADKRGRCLHFGAVKAIESRDDEGERVLAISRRLADVGGRSPFWVVPSPSRDATNTDLLFSVDDIASSTAVSLKPRLLPQNPKMLPKTRCAPRYFPQPGHEDTIAHDGRKDGRYFVVGAGHCGNGVFTDAKVADKQTDGFSGYEKRSAKRWTGVGGVEELWATFCDRLHRDGLSYRTLTGRLGRPCPCAPGRPSSGLSRTHDLRRHACSAYPTPNHQIGRLRELVGLAACGTVERFPFPSSPGSAPPDGARYLQFAPRARATERRRERRNVGRELAAERDVKLVVSSPNAAYDTDFYYDSDSDDEPQPSQARRLWAVRGLDQLFPDADSAFDALRQNMDRLKYMEVRTSTSAASLRRFAAS
ncbi:hypothetical protein C8F04DRAFT_1198070 [Mycena alexandri]|uniref:Uncharacterized protein n=1 Tax=Mycena alexandri TaxID=1745969 RepID=A0AAD6WSB3_9AGAR|nr:hypothetical protein C8F04DRAFT_1198070 [Mycena alexandri]